MYFWVLIVFLSFGPNKAFFAEKGVYTSEKECTVVAELTMKDLEDKAPYAALTCVKVKPPGKDV